MLTGRWELALYRSAVAALWLTLAWRIACYWVHAPRPGLHDSSFLFITLALAVLYASQSYLPRGWDMAVLYPLAPVVYAACITLVPREWWWPLGLGWAAWGIGGAALLAALTMRGLRRRRWQAEISGHGHDWIRRWAHGKPLEARSLAAGTLLALNYYGAWTTLRD